MKKRAKRLTLHRETVRNLDESYLPEIRGGTGGWTYNPFQCGTTCRCFDHPDTFSADCTAGCPHTSEG